MEIYSAKLKDAYGHVKEELSKATVFQIQPVSKSME